MVNDMFDPGRKQELYYTIGMFGDVTVTVVLAGLEGGFRKSSFGRVF